MRIISYPYIIKNRLEEGLNNQGTGTATAVADADAAELALLGLEDTNQSRQDTGTAGTERVANGNSTTVNVDLVLRKAKQLHVGQSDNAEGLVNLESINGLLGHASVLESLGNSQSRGSSELVGGVSGITPAEDLGNRLEAELLDLSLGNQNVGSGTVVQRGGVGGSHGAGAGNESGLHGTQLLGVELYEGETSQRVRSIKLLEQQLTYVLGLIILGDGNTRLATETGDLDGGNLVVENTGLLSSLGLLVGTDGVVVLLFTVELVVLGTLLGGQTHKLLLSVGILQTVLLNSVNQALVSVLGASAEVGQVVGGVRHGLSATSNNDIGVSGHDGLGTENDGLQAGGADLVDGGADGGIREASADSALAGRVLSNAIGSVSTN